MTASFTIARQSLLSALTAILTVVPSKPQRDILKCLKIKAESGNNGSNDTLKLFGTDLEIYVVYKVSENVIIQNDGEFVVPAHTLCEYIKNLEDDTLNIMSTSEDSLKINESGTEMEIGLQDLQEFPEFPEISDNLDWINLTCKAVNNALPKVLFAIADKDHPNWGTLSAVCMLFEKEKLTFLGTDQHRASLVELDIPGQKLETQFLVSGSALEIFPKLFISDFQLAPNPPNNMILKNEQCIFFIRLMNGNYPQIKKISSEHPQNLELSVPEFTKQVKKAALAVDNHNTIRVDIKDGKISLSTKTNEQRKVAKIEKSINYSGAGIQFMINCKYLLDLLKYSNSSEPLTLYFNRNNKPLLFTQQNFQCFLMPQEIR